jgi:prepilin-type N-terminal cleavage/methylation domain-containing protein
MAHIARTAAAGGRGLTGAARGEAVEARGADEGSTLIELLVVLAILAIIATIALPGAQTPGRAPSLRLVASDIAVRLRAARSMAIAENREVAFTFDAGTRTYGVAGIGAPRALPAAVDLLLTTAPRRAARSGSPISISGSPSAWRG